MKRFAGAILVVVATCNQNVYDRIYRQIIQQTISSPAGDRVTFERRNTAIENLRALCHGQLSTFERPELTRSQASTHLD